MKRVLLCMAALSALILTGCKKDKIDPTKPSITWESNSGFASQELTSALDAKVTVSAPGKFGELSLVMGMGQYNILVNPYIQIGNNKGSATVNPVLDLISDEASVKFVSGLGLQAGAALKDKEQVVLDLKAILEKIIEGQVIDNNTSFTVDIRMKDQSNQSLSRTAKFHYTEAPKFSWAKNPSFTEVDLGAETDCKVVVLAPGKIDQLTVKLENGADSFLTDRIKTRTTSGTTLMDLVNDAKVSESIKKLPAPSAVSGKEQVTLDFSFIYEWVPDMKASTNVFTITAVDKNGKQTVQQIKFVKK